MPKPSTGPRTESEMVFEEHTLDVAHVPEDIAQAQRQALRLTARAILKAAILSLLDSPEHAGDKETMEVMLQGIEGEAVDSWAPPVYQCL